MASAKRGKLSGPKRLPKADVEAIFDILGAANPDPKTELEFVNPYTLLVADFEGAPVRARLSRPLCSGFRA